MHGFGSRVPLGSSLFATVTSIRQVVLLQQVQEREPCRGEGLRTLQYAPRYEELRLHCLDGGRLQRVCAVRRGFLMEAHRARYQGMDRARVLMLARNLGQGG